VGSDRALRSPALGACWIWHHGRNGRSQALTCGVVTLARLRGRSPKFLELTAPTVLKLHGIAPYTRTYFEYVPSTPTVLNSRYRQLVLRVTRRALEAATRVIATRVITTRVIATRVITTRVIAARVLPRVLPPRVMRTRANTITRGAARLHARDVAPLPRATTPLPCAAAPRHRATATATTPQRHHYVPLRRSATATALPRHTATPRRCHRATAAARVIATRAIATRALPHVPSPHVYCHARAIAACVIATRAIAIPGNHTAPRRGRIATAPRHRAAASRHRATAAATVPPRRCSAPPRHRHHATATVSLPPRHAATATAPQRHSTTAPPVIAPPRRCHVPLRLMPPPRLDVRTRAPPVAGMCRCRADTKSSSAAARCCRRCSLLPPPRLLLPPPRLPPPAAPPPRLVVRTRVRMRRPHAARMPRDASGR